jgi:hypothetical protein
VRGPKARSRALQLNNYQTALRVSSCPRCSNSIDLPTSESRLASGALTTPENSGLLRRGNERCI